MAQESHFQWLDSLCSFWKATLGVSLFPPRYKGPSSNRTLAILPGVTSRDSSKPLILLLETGLYLLASYIYFCGQHKRVILFGLETEAGLD